MHRAFFSNSLATANRGPLLIGTGLTVVLAAQLWPSIPLAAAIALIGLGATLTLQYHHHYEPLLALNFVIYAALVALAVAVQMDLRISVLTQCDAILAIGLVTITIPRTVFSR